MRVLTFTPRGGGTECQPVGRRQPGSLRACLRSAGSILILVVTHAALFGSPLSQAADRWEVTHLGDAGVGSLRDAISQANAAGSGEIVFAIATGTLQVESALPTVTANLQLTGPVSRGISLNGGLKHTLLSFAAGTTSSVSRLTFIRASPSSFRHGGALSNAGFLTLDQCRFVNNTNSTGWGGALYNEGTVLLQNCVFQGNATVAPPDQPGLTFPSYEWVKGPGDGTGTGVAALGGAIFHRDGALWISNCVFLENRALGGAGLSMSGSQGITNLSAGGAALGGAVFAGRGNIECFDSRFDRNTAVGGRGGDGVAFGAGGTIGGTGGEAHGAALHTAIANLHLDRCQFTSNTNSGGQGGEGTGPADILVGGLGGSASGGAVSSGEPEVVRMEHCSLLSNFSLGGTAGVGRYSNLGGSGSGGGVSIKADLIELTSCSFISNRAHGGLGEGGLPSGGSPLSGAGHGGGLEIRGGRCVLENSTVSLNSVFAATPIVASAFAQPGDPSTMPSIHPNITGGGGVFIADPAGGTTIRYCTLVSNSAPVVEILSYDLLRVIGRVGGRGGGLWVAPSGTLDLQGSVIAGNLSSSTNTDVSARLVSSKRNLIQDPRGADGLQPNDLTSITPTLGALTNTGIGRWVHVPELNSPLIDASSDVPGLDLDQLGNPRVSGKAADLGAVERPTSDPQPATPRFVGLRLIAADGGSALEFTAEGSPGQTLILEASEDLSRWTEVDRVITGETRRVPVDRIARVFRLRPAN